MFKFCRRNFSSRIENKFDLSQESMSNLLANFSVLQASSIPQLVKAFPDIQRIAAGNSLTKKLMNSCLKATFFKRCKQHAQHTRHLLE
jgi:hypothetical protein